MDTLEGRVVVVTGAASGIGLALARRADRAGASVVLADVDADGLERAAAQMDAEPVTVVADVARRGDVEAVRDAAVERFGTVHVVCNNAGIGGSLGASWELGEQDWDRVLDVNLRGVVNGVAVFVPLLVEQDEGHVLNTASMAGLLPLPFGAPYTAAKHAVVGLSAALRAELQARRSRVGVSVLCPGWTRTSIVGSGGLSAAAEGDPAAAAIAGFVAAAVDAGVDADAVAATALDAVVHGRYWVLTHPDQAAEVIPRYEEAVAHVGLVVGDGPGGPSAQT